MKTTFSRQYALIAGLLLVCMLVTGVSFWFLMRSYVEDEKEQTLLADADAVANLARAYNSAGELEDNWGFLMSLSFISRIGDAEALICDENGRVLLCSCEQFTCGHIGQHLDVEFCDQVREGGRAFQSGILQNIYASEKRYVAGSTIVSDSTDELIGFVVVSAPMRQVSSFMSRSTVLFVYAAIFVLVLALIATSFLSRSQVRPLHQMAEAARRFGHGDLGTRVQVSAKSTEEIADLAQAFNSMAVSLEKSEQRRQEFVANVSHELKNADDDDRRLYRRNARRDDPARKAEALYADRFQRGAQAVAACPQYAGHLPASGAGRGRVAQDPLRPQRRAG